MGFVQALSSYNPEGQSVVAVALRALEEENRGEGLTATSYVSRADWFARFVWPDWPPELSGRLTEKVRDFCARCSGLRAAQEGSPDWNGVFHGWRSDIVSAEAIANALRKHFGERLVWVESERDTRGRIAAECRLKDLVRLERFATDHPLS